MQVLSAGPQNITIFEPNRMGIFRIQRGRRFLKNSIANHWHWAMFLCNITHPHGSLRASSKKYDFYFLAGLFPSCAELAKCKPRPEPLRWAFGLHFASSLRWVPAGSCAYRRWSVSSAFSPSSLFFFFPFPSVPLPPPSLHLMSQASFSPP